MSKDDPKKIHFLGIGGSGASAAAILAKKNGFRVTGCNLHLDTPYIGKVKDYKIKLFEGHNKQHLEDVEVLATSPALFFSENKIEELEYARKNKKIMSWQRFVGEYLLKDKIAISVAGTHGKSTTTAMAGLMMENSGLDPSVLIGAKVMQWDANFRYGESKYFLIESDEFFNNFLNYDPDYIILNNIEFDHPDFFKDRSETTAAFKNFIMQLKGHKCLIVNQDSVEVIDLLEKIPKKFRNSIRIIGYTIKKRTARVTDQIYKAKDIILQKGNPSFTVLTPDKDTFRVNLQVPGKHNVSNAMGAIALLGQFDVDVKKAVDALHQYKGIGRRLELLGGSKQVKVYDDYAHHPTAIKATLDALRQKHKKEQMIAVIEPHSYIRTKKLLDDYKNVFNSADKVIIGPIFKVREKHDLGVSGEDIVKIADHPDIIDLDRPEDIIEKIKEYAKEQNSVVIVMGAGNSYKWARNIVKFI